MPDCIFDGFESGDLYQNMWINDGSTPWEVTTQEPHSGTYCVRSTNKTMFSTSKLTLGVNVPVTCVVNYWAKVDCFPLNGGGFFIDNVQHGETLKDKVPWTKFSVTLSPGNHLLEWKYGNQLTEGDYENAFYVDDVTVGNAYDIYRANCDGSDETMIASAVVNAEYVDNGWVSLPIGQYKYGVSIDGGNTIYWSDCIDKVTVGVEETTEANSIKHITIVNTLGQVVYDAETTTDNSASILEQCSNGVYIVNILTDKGLVTKKVCR